MTGLTIQILQDATSNFFGRLNHLTYCGDVRMNRYLARAIPETVKDCFLFFQSSFMPDPFITQKRTLNLHSFVISISSQFPLFYDIHFFLSVKKVPVDGAILCIQNKNNKNKINIERRVPEVSASNLSTETLYPFKCLVVILCSSCSALTLMINATQSIGTSATAHCCHSATMPQ